MFRKLLLLVTLQMSFLNIDSEVLSQCSSPEKIVKGGGRDKFVLNRQSKSGVLKAGETYELVLNTKAGYDYKISSGMEGKTNVAIAFDVFENVTQKVENGEFKKIKKIVKSSDGKEPVEFQSDKVNVITIKVSLPPNDSTKPECVAILIEDRKSQKLDAK